MSILKFLVSEVFVLKESSVHVMFHWCSPSSMLFIVWFVGVPFGVVMSETLTIPLSVMLHSRFVSRLSVVVQLKFICVFVVLYPCIGAFSVIVGAAESSTISVCVSSVAV